VSDSNVDAYGVLKDTGEFRVAYNITPEAIESLKTLSTSPHWKVYRDILISAKTEYFNSILPKTETNDIVKNIGIVTGINFAINQLPVLLAENLRQAKKKVEELEKREKAKNNEFKRG
jgi:hypothetical protein